MISVISVDTEIKEQTEGKVKRSLSITLRGSKAFADSKRRRASVIDLEPNRG